MRPIRLLPLAVLGLMTLFTPGSAQAPAKRAIKPLTYAELGKEIRALRGKVVVVYFWSFT
jgi:hypothetical protein